MAGVFDEFPAVTPPTPLKATAAGVYDAFPAVQQPREASGAIESLQAGFQASAPGLAWRGKLPDLISNPEHAKWWERALTGIAQVASELPLMGVGAAVGAPAGAAIGGAITGPAAPVGAAVGGILGSGAGMFGVPAAIRESLIQSYKSGEVKTAEDFWNILRAVATTTAKEAAIGAVTIGAGAVAARTAGSVLAPAIGQSIAVPTATKAIGAADVAAQIGAMTTMPAAFEGRLPHLQEIMDAAIVIGGLKGAHVVADRIGGIYARTGKTPAEVVQDAQADPKVAEDLTAPPEDVRAPASDPLKIQEQLFTETARLDALERSAPPVDPEARPAGPALTPADIAEREALKDRITTLEARLGEAQSFETSTERVRRGLSQQLRMADEARTHNNLEPFGEDYSKAITDYMMARIVNRAKRLGKTPEEVYGEQFTSIEPGFWMPDSRLEAPDFRSGLEATRADLLASMPEATGDVRSLIAELKDMGGIHRSHMLDITGDTKTSKGMPVDLFHKNGLSLDDLVTALNERRWMVNSEDADGGVGALRDMIREEIQSPGSHFRPEDYEALGRRDERAKAQFEVQALRKALNGERMTPSEEAAATAHLDAIASMGREAYDEARAEVRAEPELRTTAENILDVDALARATEVNPEAVARAEAAFDASDDVPGFMAEIRRILDESGASADASRQAAERETKRILDAINRDASVAVREALANGELTQEAALAITSAAPGNEALQAIGVRVVTEGNSRLFAVNLMRAVELLRGDKPLDEAGIAEAEALAGAATRKQMALAEALAEASPAPDRQANLQREQAVWDAWHTDADAIEALRGADLNQSPREFSRAPETPAELDARDAEAVAQAARTNVLHQSLDTKSPEFRRWFGDSKVVDQKGEPLVVYHQTTKAAEQSIRDEGFTTAAEVARARLSDEQVPNGIFFKPNDRDIGVGSADKNELAQMPVYLSLRRPLIVADRDDLQWRMTSLSPEYDALLPRMKAIDAEYSPRFEEAFGKENSPEGDAATQKILDEWDAAGKRTAGELRALIDRTLAAEGYDGVILLNDKGSMGRTTRTYIALRSEQIKSVDNRGTFDPNDPNILHQRHEQDARAAYRIAEKRITLFKTADRSSIIHELGHDWLEEMRQDAHRPDAPQQIKDDWATLRQEFAIPEAGPIPVPAHEQFARTHERYTAEGKAPSAALQGIFERFKAWMLEIYKSILPSAQIKPEIRDVFDRMIASDEEIAMAREMGVPRAYVETAKAEAARQIVPGDAARQIAQQPFADELPKGPGEAPDNVHVNYAYINSPLDVKLAMQRMAEVDQANIQKQRGGTDGVKSWADANAEQARYVNDILGGNEDTLKLLAPRDPDAPHIDVRLGILKKLAVGAAKDSARLRDVLLEKGPDASVREQLEYMGSIERARMIQAEFLGERASVARALNALKDNTEGTGEIAKMLDVIGTGEDTLYQSRTPAEEAADLKRRLDEIMLQYNGKTPLDIAKLHKQIGTLKGAFEFSREVTKATTWQKIVEGWKAGLLSGPVTHTTNLFGTGAFMAMRAPVDLIAAGIGMARGAKVGMGESDRASAMDSVARLTGMLGGTLEALKVGYNAFQLDQPTGKTESYRQAIEGTKGDVIRIPLRLMAAEDAIVSTMYTRGELKTLAMRQAFDEGMNPVTREFAERVDSLMDKPTAEMQAAAEKAAERMTFNAPLGEKGMTLQLFVNRWNLQWMIPFIRTPINVTKELARMSPFAPVVGEWRAAIAKGGIERDRALAEVALGSGVMALTMAYAFSGNLSGAGSPDPGKNRAKAGVWQPYSVLVGDTWYEYGRIQPTGTLMGMAADLANVWDHMTPEEMDKIPKMLAVAFSNAVTNQTFLQGITNFVNATADPTRFAPRFLQQFAGSMVPNIVAQPTAMLDPVTREVNSMLEAIQARIPGMRQELLPKRDWLGAPIDSKERLGVLLPVREQKVSDDKVRQEADRLDISIAATPKKTHIGKGTGKLGDVELTPQERDAFAQAGGEMAHRILTNIVNAPGWDEMPELVQRKIYRNVLSAAHKFAAAAALPLDKRMGYIQEITQEMTAALQPEGTTP